MNISGSTVTAIILAGGQGSRLGGDDKGLIRVNGKTIIEWTLERVRAQAEHIVISANRHQQEYAAFGYPVVEDELADFQGPLAGIAAAAAEVRTPFIFVTPCDVPLLPRDTVQRLFKALQSSRTDIAFACDGEREQFLVNLFPIERIDFLRAFLQSGKRRVMDWVKGGSFMEVDFSGDTGAFLNVNTPESLQLLQQRLGHADRHIP